MVSFGRCDIYFASTSQVISQKDQFLHQSAGKIASEMTDNASSGTLNPTVLDTR